LERLYVGVLARCEDAAPCGVLAPRRSCQHRRRGVPVAEPEPVSWIHHGDVARRCEPRVQGHWLGAPAGTGMPNGPSGVELPRGLVCLPPLRSKTQLHGLSTIWQMDGERCVRVLASGATELWAANVRPGHRLDSLGQDALEMERPLHIAVEDADLTLCGTSTRDLREYPVDFAGLARHIKCPLCDARYEPPSPRAEFP
jgi:hypothetical protein